MEKVSFPDVRPPAPGESIRVVVKGAPVAVFNLGGELRALDARCTHVGGPLEKGRVADRVVTCPWHGSQFNLDTGQVVRGPATKPERTFGARLEGGILVIEAP